MEVLDLDLEFITALKKEFISDSQEHRNQLKECAESFTTDTSGNLKKMLQSTHNLKGAAHASGCSACANMFHAFENELQRLQEMQLIDRDILTAKSLLEVFVGEIDTVFATLSLHDGSETEVGEKWRDTLHLLAEFIETTRSAEKPAEKSVEKPAEKFAKKPTTPLPSMAFNEAGGSNWGVFSTSPTPTAATKPEPDRTPILQSEFDLAPVLQPESDPAPVLQPERIPTETEIMTPAAELTAHMSSAPLPPASPPPTISDDQFLLCLKGEQTYAIPVKFVREVVAAKPLKDLPVKRDNILGFLPLNGTIMPVLNMKEAFGERATRDDTTGKGCVIICELGVKVFGINVESADRVVKIPPEKLREIHTKGGAASTTTSGIRRITTLGTQSVLLLDLAAFI